MQDSLGTSLSDSDLDTIVRNTSYLPSTLFKSASLKQYKKYGTKAEGAEEYEIVPEQLVDALDEVAKDPAQQLITLERNPLDGTPLSKNNEEAIIQLAISCAQDFAKIDQFGIETLLVFQMYNINYKNSRRWPPHRVVRLQGLVRQGHVVPHARSPPARRGQRQHPRAGPTLGPDPGGEDPVVCPPGHPHPLPERPQDLQGGYPNQKLKHKQSY